MNTPAVKVERLEHSYSERIALRGISFTVFENEIFGLLGPNGGGKSTTFNILSTHLPLVKGEISVFGNPRRANADAIRKLLGVVFQSPSLDKKLTVTENLRHHGHLYGFAGTILEKRITELLERFEIAERKNDFVETLSGGLQRRVEIAKSLLHKPKLLLLDEPSTGLDPGARILLWKLLNELRTDEHITILLTTHLLEEAEKCTRIAILDEGTLVACDSPSNLKQEIGGDVIKIGTQNNGHLAAKITERFGMSATTIDSLVRIECENGHEFIPTLVAAFSDEITSITLSKPSLEDVFIHKTGRRFNNEKMI
ncbi:MAG: ATP-binding cassette domain-containing protein [Ignavibacteriales bacterium]|nr:ATP-binding cassette domain-containing protein [Ignavibacteriales bacterium]